MATGEPSLRDARAVLGVTAAATPAQVVTAFRRQARAVHPDVSHAQNAAPRFAALVAAYHVALQAAHGESGGPDLDTGARTPVSADPPPRGRHSVVTGPGGTAVWEAGRPLLLVGPVMAHPSFARFGGWQDARGQWHP